MLAYRGVVGSINGLTMGFKPPQTVGWQIGIYPCNSTICVHPVIPGTAPPKYTYALLPKNWMVWYQNDQNVQSRLMILGLSLWGRSNPTLNKAQPQRLQLPAVGIKMKRVPLLTLLISEHDYMTISPRKLQSPLWCPQNNPIIQRFSVDPRLWAPQNKKC